MVITKVGLGLGMDDLGEPPVSAGFTDEVALRRRGSSYTGLDATIAGAGGGSQKAESVASAGKHSHWQSPQVITFRVVHKRTCYLLKYTK